MNIGDDANMRVVNESEIDHMTGLYNRRVGEFYLRKCMKDSNSILTVVILDINDMLEMNEKCSHQEGTRVIQYVARKLKNDLLHNEYGIRISGDKFLLIYPDKTKDEIHTRLLKILDELDKETNKSEFYISFCYGLQEVKLDTKTSEKKIMLDCDDALYQWKRRYHLNKIKFNQKKDNYFENEEVQRFKYNESLLLRALMKSSDDYFFVCNMKDDPGTFRYSKAMVEEFKLPGEIVHDAALVWGSLIHEADQDIFLESNQEIADGRVDFHNVEYRAKNRGGEWVWLRCRGHVERNKDGEAILFAGIIETLGKKNKIDHLTGLFNKYEFEDAIERQIKKETDFGAMILDIDGFSNVNKLYNHRFGDLVLKKTAQQIQSILPQGAKLFKNDSDEFMIVFYQNVSYEILEEVFETIQTKLNKQQEIEHKKYNISMSAGACLYPQDATDLMNLSKNMNYALESSKCNGKNRCTFFDKKMLIQESRKLDILEQLRNSMEHDFEGFEMHFQPQVKADDQSIIGAEALARWQCDLYGNVPPMVFIPLLEENGMIHVVGRWIFETSIRLCKEFLEIDPNFTVSINLSYLQVTEKDFVEFLNQTLKKYNVDSSQVIVEMTESRMMDDESHLDILAQIRDTGIRIAIDDFGTGFSSLGVLKKSPADIVKIDKVFMKDVLISSFDATFIRFIVSLCHDVNITVLLEGVETKEEYEKVREMNLDFIQGYYFGRPIPADKLKEELIKCKV